MNIFTSGNKKNRWILLFCIIYTNWLIADDIRGLLTQEVLIKAEAGYVKQISMTAGEIAAISLEKNSEFLSGLQIEIVLPDLLKQNAEYFVLEIFNNITPQPDVNAIAYSGNNIFFQVLPYLNTINIKLPFNTPETRHQTPGNYTLSKAIRYNQFPILFTLQTISKGVSDTVLLKNFYIKIKPELIKKGYLNLKIIKPDSLENDKINVYIDGTREINWKSALLLDSGVHALQVMAENFMEENSSFLIETAKTSSLEITLKEAVSKLFIDILPGTVIFLDGNKMESLPKDGIPVSPGNHTLRFKIGDYSLSKSIYIYEGKKYNITLFFNIDIKEN